MFRLKLTSSRWVGYTGQIGMVAFKDGVSVDPVSQRTSDRLAAAMPMVLIDEDGNEVGEAGVVPRLLRDSADRQAEMRKALPAQTDAERKAEDLQLVLKASKSPTETFYTHEQLQAIADERGIKGIRVIAEPWNVKGKAIPALIELILAAQNKFLEQKEGVIKAVADAAEPDVIEEKAEELTDIQTAAATGNLAAAITTSEVEEVGGLFGSSVLAASYEIEGETVTLGDLVRSAFELSGATAAEWNELPDADREDLIRAELDRRLPKE